MKTYKSLYYTGLTIVSVPIFLIIFMVILPLCIQSKKEGSEDIKEEHVIVYDTVKISKSIKVYDTIRPKKKKPVEKIDPVEVMDKVVTDTLKNN